MFVYDQFDRDFVHARAAQYRDQLQRWQAGSLSEDEFRPLRLQNGWYVQRHAPMLRVAVPWGELASRQVRMLAKIARDFDRGYAHLTTRQNLQYNWIALDQSAQVMDLLASVDMHGIQTSGNCVRNITCDPLAGVAVDEIFDVRPYAELVREWSSLHPEFSFLPRKFKIAMNGASEDRIALRWHDIGVQAVVNDAGERGFQMYVGGGMGRTPIVAPVLREFLPAQDLLVYIEAILRAYNLFGRRDNIYKARIKILVKAQGQEFIDQVEAEYRAIIEQDGAPHRLRAEQVARITDRFVLPTAASSQQDNQRQEVSTPEWQLFVERNVLHVRDPAHCAVLVCIKGANRVPGDVTAEQFDQLADLADEFSRGEIRVTREQNFVFPYVTFSRAAELFVRLQSIGLTEVLGDSVADVVCCPGGDYCSLANARSLPVEHALQKIFVVKSRQQLGPIDVNISGCINSCGHHHSGGIGILGVDKDNQEYYQITIGGSDGRAINGPAQAGKVIGASFAAHEVPKVVDAMLSKFESTRHGAETFVQTVRRVGLEPFKLTAQEVREQAGETTLESSET